MARSYDDWDHVFEELEILTAQDFRIKQFSEYHFRVNERIDVWPSKRRWYDIKSRQRGFYHSIVELVHGFLGYKTLPEQQKTI